MDKNKLHTLNLFSKELEKMTKLRDEIKEVLEDIENKCTSAKTVFKVRVEGKLTHDIKELKIPHHLSTFSVEDLLKKQLEYVERSVVALKAKFDKL